MRRATIFSLALLAVIAAGAHAKPAPPEVTARIASGSSPWVRFPAASQKGAVDTTYIFGGPGTWEGRFETPGGQPDWHGWTHVDLTVPTANHWQVSTYQADQLGGHGPGNHAMNCGDVTIPACPAGSDIDGGYGNRWFDHIAWSSPVSDPTQPVTVRLTGFLNYDTEDGYDYVQLLVQRGSSRSVLATWDGLGPASEILDFTTVVAPDDYTGPGGDQVRLLWRFQSDGSYSDEDCVFPTRGACRIDDIEVTFDGSTVTFDDFEPGNPVTWVAVAAPGVGDFANLRNDLGDRDSCPDRFNNSYMVNFVDDGIVVPGTGGTACIDWCYDPGGWVVNHNGGLMQDAPGTWRLDNRVVSPPIAWIPGMDGAELALDLYIDDGFTEGAPGIVIGWFVRSTASPDPADLENAPWLNHGGDGEGLAAFRRIRDDVSDLMVADRQWAQVSVRVLEQNNTGLSGINGTPAPYFDNVALKIWDPVGPAILVRNESLITDAFPESGFLDPSDPASHWCRVDANTSDFFQEKIVVEVKPVRGGATVESPPLFHWVLQCNPTFNPYRTGTPGGQGILRGTVTGGILLTSQGTPWPDHWSFDLPDTGFFWPGDRLHYYITASDESAGDVRTSVWPPDTTGVIDFLPESPYPTAPRAQALPTLTTPQPGQFDQPPLLMIELSSKHYAEGVGAAALRELGFQQGIDFDVMTTYADGIGVLSTTEQLDGYETILFDALRWWRFSDTGDDNDAQRVLEWLATGNRRALFAGNDLSFNLQHLSPVDGLALLNQLGVHYEARDIVTEYGSGWDLQVSPLSGNGILPMSMIWPLDPACRDPFWMDAITATGVGVSRATVDPLGGTTGLYSALVTVDDPTLGNRTATMPFDLGSVTGMTGGTGSPHSPAAAYLDYLLHWLDTGDLSGAGDPPAIGQVAVSAHPNPFNPRTTIAFDLPRAAEVSLDIYDLHGRLVRRLLDGTPHTAGSHKQVWDGRDGTGRATASGVYFYRFKAGQEKRVGKLTLLK